MKTQKQERAWLALGAGRWPLQLKCGRQWAGAGDWDRLAHVASC